MSETTSEWSSEAMTLAALAVPPDGRVLVVGGTNDRLATQIQGRAAVVEVVADYREPADDLSDERPFDAVVLADGIAAFDDPIGSLRRMGALLPAGASLVVLAKNITHVGARLRALRGEPPPADATGVPLRSYDLAALREVFARAGLVVVEVLRVTEVVDAATLPPVGDDPEATTSEFVVVAQVGAEPDRFEGTLVAFLQMQVAQARRELTTAGVTELSLRAELGEAYARSIALEGGLSLAEEELREARAAIAEREEMLRDRIAENERVHVQRRHLTLDLAVRDAYVEELRLELRRAADAAHRAEDAAARAEDEVARLLAESDTPIFRLAEAIHHATSRWHIRPRSR